MRQFIVSARHLPQFDHRPKAMSCGLCCARFIVEAGGMKWNESWPMTLPFPMFPGRMVRMLKWNNQRGYVAHVPRESRIAWLQDRISFEETPALFVRTRWYVPFPTHWIVVCGMGNGKFFIYDSMIGSSSKDPNLPVGNTMWTGEHLLEKWQDAPLFRSTSTAVIPF